MTHFSDNLKYLVKGIDDESDRGCVLIAAAFIEDQLEQLLRGRFCDSRHCQKHSVNELFRLMGPLSSFSAKTHMAYALTLISKNDFTAINSIRKIRNDFAHKFEEASFEDRQTRDHVSNIAEFALTEKQADATKKDVKLMFVTSVGSLIARLSVGYVSE